MKSFWEAVCGAHQQYRPKNVNQWTADLGWQKAASGTSCHPFDIVFQVGLNGFTQTSYNHFTKSLSSLKITAPAWDHYFEAMFSISTSQPLQVNDWEPYPLIIEKPGRFRLLQ